MPKVLKTLYIDITQYNYLKELSKITRVPQSVYIREGIDFVVKKYEQDYDINIKSRNPSKLESL